MAASTFLDMEALRSMFMSIRARLSALRQVLSCSRAMLRRVGKYRIPSVKFHRIVRVYLRSVKFVRVLVQ